MSQIKKASILFCMLLALAVFVSGCGDANPEAIFDFSDVHPAGWLPAEHVAAASADIASCTECHGEALDGGVAATPCTLCHLGSASEVHPLPWGDFAYSRHNSYVGANGTSSCANVYCHGAALGGVAESGPSCTSCHMGGVNSVHPTDWTDDVSHGIYVGLNGTISCATAACHGLDLMGVVESGPSCFNGSEAGCHP